MDSKDRLKDLLSVHTAVIENNEEDLRELINKKADINAVNKG